MDVRLRYEYNLLLMYGNKIVTKEERIFCRKHLDIGSAVVAVVVKQCI